MPIFSAAISQTLYDYINGLITAEQAGPDVVALAALLNPTFGTDGEDRLSGTSAADVLFGGASQDFFFGGKGNDLIYTGSGTDYVRAGAGDDTLLGEDGDDRLWGDNGNDRLTGGSGDDTFAWNTGDGRDFITDVTAGQDSLTIDGLVVDSDHFQVTDGDLSLRGQSEVIGTINESANGLSILLDGGSVVIIGATLSDLDIAAPETTLYGSAGVDDFFGFNLSDSGPVDIVDFEVGADTVYLVTGITDADYSGLFVGSDGRIFTDYEDPYTTQTYGDTIGPVTFVNGNTVITAEASKTSPSSGQPSHTPISRVTKNAFFGARSVHVSHKRKTPRKLRGVLISKGA